MKREFPGVETRHPLVYPDGSAEEGTVFLAAVIDHPRITVGAYSYASNAEPCEDWAARLAPYLFEASTERLVIGKFCQIAHGVEFVTASANHRYDGATSYPFAIFDGGFSDLRPSLPEPGPDTIIGNDVWIGRGATILPGARLGDGVIVGAKAVVTGEIPPYSVVAGNPGQVIRRRFDEAAVACLRNIAWWNWPIDVILAEEEALCSGDLVRLEQVSRKIEANLR